MKFILTVLAALTIGFAGIASANSMQDSNATFPEGSVQNSTEH